MRSKILPFIFVCFLLSDILLFAQEGGYGSRMSVQRGDTLSFYISTSVSPFNLTIYKSSTQQEFITSYDSITGMLQSVPDSSYYYGCRWNETYRIVIPETWESGVYRAKFPTSGGIREILFVVKENNPGTTSRILFMLNTSTYNAYNGYGGKSTYEYNSSDKIPSVKVSFLRPADNPGGFEDFFDKEELFIKWAAENNYDLEYAINYDVHSAPGLLSNYDVVVTSGHSEYWSLPERRQFENFINSGGKLVLLSGNNVWWQVRYEDNGNTMVCYKGVPDPMQGIADSLVTTNWKNYPVNNPENSFTGTSWASGGYVTRNGFFHADGFGDYSAYNTHHWVFNGTGLTEGAEFGYESSIVGVEADGAVYNWVNGIPVLTGTDTSPKNFRVLGYSPALNADNSTKFGMMGIYYKPDGGAVFNAGTMNWNHGLPGDTTVRRITKNVLEQFLSGNLPPEITSWEPFIVEAAVINQQDVYLNKRELNMIEGQTKKFSVKAEDPNQQVSYLWEVNGILAGTDSVFNFTLTGNDPSYIIRAYAINNTDTSSINWKIINVLPPPPLVKPVLMSPGNNAAGQPLEPVMRWLPVNGAEKYHVQLSFDSLFTSLYSNDSLKADTAKNVYGLPFNTTFYWRVKAKNEFESGPWSDIFRFTTIGTEGTFSGGYADKMSVKKGEDISFRISTSVSPFTLSVYRTESQPVLVASYPSITGGLKTIPDSAFAKGCNWPETFKLRIPAGWLPGAYRARFPVEGGTREIIFYVQENSPGSYAKVLMVANVNTWQAYNNFGGKSIYEYNSTNNVRAYKLSFLRPSQNPGGFSDFAGKEEKFIKWAFQNNIKLEYATNYDVYKNPGLLQNFDAVVTVGHSEYWSLEERNHFQNYINNGGKFVILSGNTCWWQIRYEDNGNTLVCYKSELLDPLFGTADSLVTVNWTSYPVNYPENSLTGLSYIQGGYVNFDGRLLASDGYGDYAAYNTHHWMYSGTNLKEGQEFGYSNTIVGYEVDGTLFNWINGLPVVSGSYQTPMNYRITALSPSTVGGQLYHATMGIFHKPNGGAVFNAAVTDWADGLPTDQTVQLITKNIFSKFLSKRFPPEITGWSPYIVKPVIINKENVFINQRDINVMPDSSLTFSLTVIDPYNSAVNYIWKVNGIEKSRDSVYTFVNNQSLALYTIEAFVYNSVDTTSISWKVNNLGLYLAKPSLILPVNNQQDVSGNPVFKWQKTENSDKYYFEVSTDPSFNSLLYNDTNASDTVKVLESLQPGVSYYWRVKAQNDLAESEWSEIWTFKTISGSDSNNVYKIVINAMSGTFSGDARLGTMAGSINTRAVYFQGTAGGVSFNINIPQSSGIWYAWARMYYMSSGGKNSFFVTLNNNKAVVGDDDTKYNQWHWDGNNGSRVSMGKLNAGQYTLLISGREPGLTLWIDQVILTDDPYYFPEGFILKNANPVESPLPPLLQLPVNNSIVQSLPVTLKWNSVSGIQGYILNVSESQSFSSLVLTDSALTDTTKTLSLLGYAKTYYWRVKSKNIIGESNWSVVYSFTTAANPDTIPKTNIILNAMNGTFSGDARLGTMSGSVNSRVVYFQGLNGGVSLNVNIPSSTRNWYIWGRMYYMSSGGKNSFFVTANGNKFIIGDDTTKYNQWHWDGYNGRRINIGTMTAGSKTILISGREPGLTLWIDQLIITDDPDFLPAGFTLRENPVSLPAIAELVSPSDSVTNQPLQLALRWKKALNAAGYYLNLSASSDFSSVLVSDSSLTDTIKSVTLPAYQTTYFWRVKSRNNDGEAVWSKVFRFTTASDPDTIPKTNITLNAMSGTFSGDARLGTMSGSVNTRVVYFQGLSGGVSFNINIPQSSRNWYIYGRMYYMSSGGKNSFFVTANGNKLVLGDDTTKYNQWHWDGSNGYKLNIGTMTAGQKTIIISGREPGLTLWIDQLIITDDPNFLPPGFVPKTTPLTLPAVPEPAAPADLAVNQPLQPVLKWKKALNAAGYYLHVSTSSQFTTLQLSDSSLTDTLKQLSSLTYSTKYFWRVKSKNNDGESTWSNIFSFTTMANPDTIPKNRITLNAMSGTLSGDARLGTMTGQLNSRSVYFIGTNGGTAFSVNFPSSSREWYVWGRMYYMSSGGKNSFFVTVNGTKYILGDDDSKYNQWHWDGNIGKLKIGVVPSGQRTVVISGREPGTTLWIDQMILTDDPDFNPNISLAKTGSENEIVFSAVPEVYSLSQNFPNPFNPVTNIRYSIPEASHVILKVFDIMGQEVTSLTDEVKQPGFYEVQFNGSSLASGVYIIQLRSNNFMQTKKMNLLK